MAAAALLGAAALQDAPGALAVSVPYPPSPSAVPTATESPRPAPDPALTEVQRVLNAVVIDLPPSLPSGSAENIDRVLDELAVSLASSGLTPAQQVEAARSVADLVEAVPSTATPEQLVAVTEIVASAAASIGALPAGERADAMTGISRGLGVVTSLLTDPAVRSALGGTIAGVVDALTSVGEGGASRTSLLERIITTTANAVADATGQSPTGGVVATPVGLPDGSVRLVVGGLKPNTQVTVVINITDRTVAAALARALGAAVLGARLGTGETVSLVLTTVADQFGNAVVTAPGSALGTRSAQSASEVLSNTVLTVAATNVFGVDVVTAAAGVQTAIKPTLRAASRAITAGGSVVLTGTGQPASTVYLLAAPAGGPAASVAHALVGPDGVFQFRKAPQENTRFSVLQLLGSDRATSWSVPVDVRPVVRQTVRPIGGGKYRVSGVVSPAARQVVTVFRNSPAGSVKVGTVRVHQNGRYEVVVALPRGSYGLFSRVAANARLASAVSGVSQVKVA